MAIRGTEMFIKDRAGGLVAPRSAQFNCHLGDRAVAVAVMSGDTLGAVMKNLQCAIAAAYGGQEERDMAFKNVKPMGWTIEGQQGQAVDHGGDLRIQTIQTKVRGPAEQSAEANKFLDRLTAQQIREIDNRHAQALMAGPPLDEGVKPLPKKKPPRVSCGQVWKRGRELFEVVDEEPGRGVAGFWRLRRQDDGEERDVNGLDFRDESWEHVSGGQETAEEAVLRVCKREMARPPRGVSALRWRCVVAALREECKAKSPEGHACGIKFYCHVARLVLEVKDR